jgi:hypothetical protein
MNHHLIALAEPHKERDGLADPVDKQVEVRPVAVLIGLRKLYRVPIDVFQADLGLLEPGIGIGHVAKEPQLQRPQLLD